MLDLAGGVYPGQARSEYPATSVPFSNLLLSSPCPLRRDRGAACDSTQRSVLSVRTFDHGREERRGCMTGPPAGTPRTHCAPTL
jgi:hypothetical protein